MYSSRDCTLSAIKTVQASARRAEGRVELHSISGELTYTARTEKRLSQSTAASASSGLVESALRESSFASDAADEVFTYWCEEELPSSPSTPPLMKRPLSDLFWKNQMQPVGVR
ncbi:hypothetical protein B9Z19DRAFT_1066942 [Tuber borchii]|uniref:Uncharacterized protein n=1 Tax=Tuber borchii TaxID=42251 RepID=A0A2T6ZKN8_TUBBO|nr:hypothetical protein B9Z19DRAFT_1066942 [Tuber borchii]